MKYKVGVMKNRKIKIKLEITGLISRKCPSIVKPANTGAPTVSAIKRKKFSGYFPFKDSPFWFKNVLSELKVTFEFFFTKYGMSNIVIQNAAALAYIYSVKRADTDIPELIPKPKTKFQKLSLFSRSLIQFIQSIILNAYELTVSSIWKKFNINRKLSVVMAATLIASVANAGELEAMIGRAEREYNIPKDLLLSIALVESKVNPYALNVEGKTLIEKSMHDVQSKLKSYLKKGYHSIDIGVMQINYRWHREKFTSLDEMLDPERNIDYAARYLRDLYKAHGSWIKAVRHYHSSNPKYHKKYSKKIIVTWLNS